VGFRQIEFEICAIESVRSVTCEATACRVEAGSILSVTSDLKLSSSYRNSMVKHEPELYTCVASDVCCQIAAKKDQVPFAMTSKGALTRTFVVAGTGFEPVTSGL